MESANEPPLNLDERGADGKTSGRRLFMQLLAFTECPGVEPVIAALRQAHVAGTLYLDVNDPRGIALVAMSEEPDYFTGPLRDLLNTEPFASLTPRPTYTMFGRTYSLGYEPDLDETLVDRPRRHVLEPAWPWAVWYPLRRSGAFVQLPAQRQRDILMEHGRIGMAYGRADAAHDIRLACFGLDPNDNDFVIGLVGRQLAPLSILVQSMRKTTQTSMYIERLGPFFVGRAVWRGGQAT